MSGIYHTVLLNDIVKRLKISDVNMLEAITRFMMHNIGNRTSPATIANTMTSMNMKIDPKTVDRYLRGLTDSLLFYEARRYNVKGKKLLSSMNKYYISHIFKESMGISLHQYIIQRRIEACKNALLTQKSLEEIAELFGFANYSSFFRLFKKTYGMSPKEYREEMEKELGK